MATYYNKNLIDGISELPRMSKAEFDALSLDEKPINWICRNYTGTQRGIKSSDVEHGTGTVEDAITDITGHSWSNAIQLGTDTGFKIFGRYNEFLKMAYIRISGQDATPSSSVLQFTITNSHFNPIEEYGVTIRYGGNMIIQSGQNPTIIIRDLNTSQKWLNGYMIYPTQ